jgi:hypothetical protein
VQLMIAALTHIPGPHLSKRTGGGYGISFTAMTLSPKTIYDRWRRGGISALVRMSNLNKSAKGNCGGGRNHSFSTKAGSNSPGIGEEIRGLSLGNASGVPGVDGAFEI